MPDAPSIRLVALAVIRRGDDLLVFDGHDPVAGEHFHRLLGGGIEFGETGAQAIRREILEEIAVELTDVRYLGTLENIFDYRGTPGHEVHLIYEAEVVDQTLMQQDTLQGIEGATPIVVRWLALSEVRDGRRTLYPDGLLDLLAAHA